MKFITFLLFSLFPIVAFAGNSDRGGAIGSGRIPAEPFVYECEVNLTRAQNGIDRAAVFKFSVDKARLMNAPGRSATFETNKEMWIPITKDMPIDLDWGRFTLDFGIDTNPASEDTVNIYADVQFKENMVSFSGKARFSTKENVQIFGQTSHYGESVKQSDVLTLNMNCARTK